jgi:NAD(P)-dependent dehydrogenase (short-subunit alcohol dehydrogenase family)
MTVGTQPVALVTGVSSGIGQAIAARLTQAGYRVYGGMRSPKPDAAVAGVIPVRVDLRDDASMESAVAEILAAEGRIDVLVNSAGMTLTGSIEETAIDQARELFDTDFFGLARLTQLVLPAMRDARRGRIINIGSVYGVIPAAFMGYYSAAKHAIEGYTESLDHETRAFGIRAVVIEPSFMRTRLNSAATAASGRIAAYQAARSNAERTIGEMVERGGDPGLVAAAVVRAVKAGTPRRRYAVGGSGRVVALLRRFAPAAMFDPTFRRIFKLDT